MRVALLNSGFYVANGEGTGSKKETIVALSPGFPTPCPYPLVGQEWLERWRRSSKKFPDGLTPEQQAAAEKRIEGHPQFSTKLKLRRGHVGMVTRGHALTRGDMLAR